MNGYNYGVGVVRSGSWLLQNPLLDGYSATEAYLPSKKIAIAVAVTFTPEAFDSQGNYKNSSDIVFRSIGAYVAPDVGRVLSTINFQPTNCFPHDHAPDRRQLPARLITDQGV